MPRVRKAFGAFRSERELGEVVWRFDPRAAEHARGFEFHPDQVMEDQPEDSLVVRFGAAGWTEMAWHLYQWGETVEVRWMVEGYRRSDFFPVLPAAVFVSPLERGRHGPPGSASRVFISIRQ